MVSKKHQLIEGCIARKIREMGYKIVAYDGDYSQIERIPLKVPPTIIRHRPDMIGVNVAKSEFCIGEAKTSSDLRSKRTKDQFVDFSNQKNSELVIGVPLTDKETLLAILKQQGLENKNNVHCIYVPKELLPDEGI